MLKRLQLVFLTLAVVAIGAGLPVAAQADEIPRSSTRMTIVNLSGKTLLYDAQGSFAFSRLHPGHNTARFIVSPAGVLPNGSSTVIRIVGQSMEGLYARIMYQDAADNSRNITVESHIHVPPHGNWVSAWGDNGLSVDFTQDLYTDNSVEGTGIVRST